ncbi:MAG: cation:proton antiporter [Gemmatimonadota bacterium]|nr:cation:proton antiporter [Gemmatimonadota bacterium]
MNLQDPALTFAFALTAGVLAQAIARHLRIPGIVLLLLTGVILGPEFLGLVRPDILGDGLQPMVGLAVAVILFEGGLQLNIARLRREAVAIRRLVTIGALVTVTGATLAAQFIMGWSVEVSILFGTLVSVTGPTVINPLTRRIGLRPNLRTILEGEGVLIDPIGAILAVVALEMVLATTAGDAAFGLLGLPGRLGLGALIGVAGGFMIGGLLRMKRVVPHGFENIFTLAFVLMLFQASHAILPESGIMTVAIAGLVVGNMPIHRGRELAEFKEQLTTLLVGFLFVMLSAAVRLDDVAALGIPGVLTVVVLMLVVRPADVALATWGTDYTLRERAFIAWLGPRGIVAFAVSSLFATELAHNDMTAEGVQLRALVFLVIAMTVVIQGGGAGVVARLLAVRMKTNHGFVLAGANAIARLLARTLREASADEELPIVLVDTNAHEATSAEEQGFRVIFGNASQTSVLLRAAVSSRRAFVAVTPNEGINLLLAKRVQELHGEMPCLVSIDSDVPGVTVEGVHEARCEVLFGRGVDFEYWGHELRQERVDVSAWSYGGADSIRVGTIVALSDPGGGALALVRRRGSRIDPVTDVSDVRSGDTVWFAVTDRTGESLAEELARTGWVREERPANA